MNYKARLHLTLFFFLIILLASCREAEETATPPATAVPPTTETQPINTPSPTNTPEPTLFDDAGPLHPRVIGQNPALGEEAALDGRFELYFDQPMQPDAAEAVQIVDEQGEPVAGDLSWPQPRILRFKPTKILKPNTRYQAQVRETAESAEGVPLLEGLTLDFYTIGDLSVSQMAPVDGATEVATDSTITVIFNRPVVPLLVAEENADLPDPLTITPDISGQGEWLNTSVYIYRPDEALLGRQAYTVRVQADVINAASATGAQMVEDFVSSFRVMPPTFDYLELVGVTRSPHDGWQNLPLDQTYRLHFNQPMDAESTETAVTLRNLDNETTIHLTFAWDEEWRGLTITPTQQLELETDYLFLLSNTAESAHGGRLDKAFTWKATTYKHPTIIRTEPVDGETQRHYSSVFSIEFASPMDEDSLEGKVIITPDILGDPNGLYNAWGWKQYYYGFKPSTTYTVEILPGMTDIYGNEIKEGQTVTFTTADLPPSSSLNLPYSVALYRSGGSESLWVTHQNVDELRLDLYEVPLQDFGNILDGDIYALRHVPAENRHIWGRAVAVDAPLNEVAHKRFVLDAADTNNLPPGYYFVTLDSPQVQHNETHLQAQVLLMTTANVTLKTTAAEAMIWVTDLDTGEPLPGTAVRFYDEDFNLVFQDQTDEFGLVYRDDLNLETDWRSRYFAVAGAAGSDLFGLAMSDWHDGITPRDFGIYTDYYLRPNEPTGYIYTERPIYRPGQPVYFKGIIRLNDDLSYSLPGFDEVEIEISSFDEVIHTADLPISDYGSFTGEITLDNEAALGGYRINVNTLGGRHIGTGYFEVAEFRKPTFQVEVAAAESDVAVGETIEVTVDASFFSGGGVVGGEVEWNVRAEEYVFRGGRELNRYSFRNRERDLGYYYYNNDYNPSEVIAQGMGQTDGQGQIVLEIPAELNEGDGSSRFIIEATVTDLAGNQVSGRTPVIVHRSRVYPGVKPDRSVGEAGELTGFDVITVDWNGEPVTGQPVSVAVVERRWYSVQEEDDRGRTIWRSEVEEIPVEVMGESELVTERDGRVQFSFIPPKGGVYRAIVTTQDGDGNSASASTYMWVSSGEYVSWRRVNDHSFELISDSGSYVPGDTAEILIASPFQGEVSALVTVERGHIKQHEVIRLTSNSTIYRLPITGDMAPNVFVSVLVMKGVDETSLAPDFKLGMTQFTVDREEQELAVEITADETQLSPGDTVNYTVKVTDH
ncbi:MAG: hypothetical protein GY796_25675, partial [Chloroflexi bacterium]|nr:hypothetical protein [Chloroflexota bacterium]